MKQHLPAQSSMNSYKRMASDTSLYHPASNGLAERAEGLKKSTKGGPPCLIPIPVSDHTPFYHRNIASWTAYGQETKITLGFTKAGVVDIQERQKTAHDQQVKPSRLVTLFTQKNHRSCDSTRKSDILTWTGDVQCRIAKWSGDSHT